MQIGAKPLFTVTKESFLNDLIEKANGKNIARDALGGVYSRESVFSKNPEFIIIVVMGILQEEERTVWKRYASIDAVKNNRVFALNPDILCRPTPISFARALGMVAGILYPEAQKVVR